MNAPRRARSGRPDGDPVSALLPQDGFKQDGSGGIAGAEDEYVHGVPFAESSRGDSRKS